jgi:hypothetical protein
VLREAANRNPTVPITVRNVKAAFSLCCGNQDPSAPLRRGIIFMVQRDLDNIPMIIIEGTPYIRAGQNSLDAAKLLLGLLVAPARRMDKKHATAMLEKDWTQANRGLTNWVGAANIPRIIRDGGDHIELHSGVIALE